ncbi:DUF3850 domain-containing protein [Cronobacter dublinensis]
MSEIREPATHNLKIWSEHYSAVCAGVKRAELRKNDRDYRVGDTLDLCEWDKDDESFTGNYISVTVTHVADVGEWMPGYVLLSIELALRERAEPIYQERLFHVSGKKQIEYWAEINKGAYQYLPESQRRIVYTAPPSPVVPDLSLLDSLAGEFLNNAMNNKGKVKETYTWCAHRMAETVRDCRDAMLAAPGKQPLSAYVLAGALRNAPLSPSDNQGRQRVPIADGWIACSERFPEVGDIVLTADHGGVNVGEMERSGSGYRYFTSVVSGRELPATHWMPLPAAPGKEG